MKLSFKAGAESVAEETALWCDLPGLPLAHESLPAIFDNLRSAGQDRHQGFSQPARCMF
jgi:hypothetical protein